MTCFDGRGWDRCTIFAGQWSKEYATRSVDLARRQSAAVATRSADVSAVSGGVRDSARGTGIYPFWPRAPVQAADVAVWRGRVAGRGLGAVGSPSAVA